MVLVAWPREADRLGGTGLPVAEEDGSRPSGARIRDGRPVKVIHPRPRGGGRDGRKSSGVGVGFLFLDREGLEWVDEFLLDEVDRQPLDELVLGEVDHPIPLGKGVGEEGVHRTSGSGRGS